MKRPTVSLKAYAAHRGVSVQAVKKAIKKERLKRSVVRTPAGHFKVRSIEAADMEWSANTDPSLQRGVAAVLAGSDPQTASDADPEAAAGDSDESYAQSRAKRERYEAKISQLKYEQQAGKLVSREEFEAIAVRVASDVKSKLLGVPSKAKQRIPTLKPAEIAILEDLIREALEGVVDGGD